MGFVKSLKKLEYLELNRTQVSDLTPLKDLGKLRSLELEGTPVTDLSLLPKLKNLGSLHLNQTKPSSLAPLGQCKELHSVLLHGVNTTLHELLGVLNAKLKDADEFLGLVSLYHRLLDEPEEFVAAVESYQAPVNDVASALAVKVNNWLIHMLKDDERQPLAGRLVKAYLPLLAKAPLTAGLKEQLASNTVVAIVKGLVDEASCRLFFDSFLPKTITLSTLALNLACHAAKQQKKAELLKYLALAIELGHDRGRISADADFAAYKDDPEFKALVSKSTYPDPERETMRWWKKLSDDVRQQLSWRSERMIDGDVSAEAILEVITHPEFEFHGDGLSNLDFLAGLTHLKKLTLPSCNATDLGAMASLRELTELVCERDQYSGGTQFEDLTPLQGLHNLTVLKLNGHKITDISPLTGLTKLETLHLFNNPIGDVTPLAGLVELNDLSVTVTGDVDTAAFANLQNLSLFDLDPAKGARLVSLAGLSKMTKLRYLWIKDWATVDGKPMSLAPLAKLTSLENLFLSKTAIDSVEPLFGLSSLKWLHVSPKVLTDDMRKQLKAKLPKCKVD